MTCSDNNGNGAGWTSDAKESDVGDGNTILIASTANHASGSTTITCTADVGSIAFMWAQEYSGLASSSILDVAKGNNPGGTTTPGTGNTGSSISAVHELVTACVYASGGGGGTFTGKTTLASTFSNEYTITGSFHCEDGDAGSTTATTSVITADFNTTVGAGTKIVIASVYKLSSGIVAATNRVLLLGVQ
jgi:hypothetical protein